MRGRALFFIIKSHFIELYSLFQTALMCGRALNYLKKVMRGRALLKDLIVKVITDCYASRVDCTLLIKVKYAMHSAAAN